MDTTQPGTIEVPTDPPIMLDAVGTVFKLRADAAEALCIRLADQQRGHLACIERLRADLAEQDRRIAILTAEALAEAEEA